MALHFNINGYIDPPDLTGSLHVVFMYSPRVQGLPLISESGTTPPEHIRERKSRLHFISSPAAPFFKTSQ